MNDTARDLSQFTILLLKSGQNLSSATIQRVFSKESLEKAASCQDAASLFAFLDSLKLPELKEVRLSSLLDEVDQRNVDALNVALQGKPELIDQQRHVGAVSSSPNVALQGKPELNERRVDGTAVLAAAISGAIAGAVSPVPGGALIGAIGAGLSAAITGAMM